jgi:hypothetical protein
MMARQLVTRRLEMWLEMWEAISSTPWAGQISSIWVHPGTRQKPATGGAYYNASSQQLIESATNDAGVYLQVFWGNANSTSAEKPVVNPFAPGATGDMPAQTSTVLGSVQTAGAAVSATANVIVDGIASYANATALACALSGASSRLAFAGTDLGAKDSAHMLLAYSTGSNVDVADVEFNNASAISQGDTALLSVFACDMVQTTGVSLSSLARTISISSRKRKKRAECVKQIRCNPDVPLTPQ